MPVAKSCKIQDDPQRHKTQWNLRNLKKVTRSKTETTNPMRLLLLILLIVLLLGALPTWPYSSGWGYYPSGGLLLLIVLVILLVRPPRV
jgi:hypothetical protein